jgi:hypothetical protein
MISMQIEVGNLDRLRANVARSPDLALKYLAKATKAAIFEVEKQAIDSNFQFKTPRVFRTGRLSLSFAHGRVFENNGLRGRIGPTATSGKDHFYYPGKVHQTNPYMERIAKVAEPHVVGHFEKAIDLFIDDISKI